MKLYHYTTWQGSEVFPLGKLVPSEKYLKEGPPLVWLTENEYWEPSIQAKQMNGSYERGPSSPGLYSTLGIPCWRFEVEVKDTFKLHYPIAGWLYMLEDGKDLGSDLSQWHWVTDSVEIVNSYKWIADKWEKQND